MKNKMGMYQGYSVEGSAELKVTPDNVTKTETSSMCCPAPAPIMCSPIIECPQERCVHREIIHEVPQE